MSFRYRSILLALLLPLFMAGAAEPEFRMTYSVFFPATHVHTQLAREWAAEVEKRSEGRLVIDVYPGGILSGAGENYECVVKGVSDLGMSCFSYSRGMFPMMEGLDLPLGYQDGRQATRVANAYVRTFELPELADTRLLYVHAHGPGVLAARRPVTSVKELEGLSVRGTGISALIIRALGCNAIGMGQPDTYEALRKGVVDATLCPVETLKGWRQGEVISDVVKIPSAGYTTAMFVVMNRGSWSRLPADLRQILLEVSDEWIPKHGAAWNEADDAAAEFVTGLGKKISAFSPEADAAAAQRLAPILEEWADTLEARDLPGRAALNFIQAELAKDSCAPLPPRKAEADTGVADEASSGGQLGILTAVMALVILSGLFTIYGGRAQAAFWQLYRVTVLKLTHILAAFSGILLLAIIGLTIADIIGRRLGHPLLGAMDLVQILICLSTACAMPYVTALKGHIAVEFLFQRLAPVKRIFWDTINRLAAVAFFTCLVIVCMKHGARLLEQKAVALSLGIPLFWVLWVVGGAFITMLLVIIYNLNHPGREMTRP